MKIVLLTPQAQKELMKIPLIERKKIIRQIRGMENGAVVGKKLSGELKNYLSIRAWPYRIIYFEVQKKLMIVHIKHRQGVYK